MKHVKSDSPPRHVGAAGRRHGSRERPERPEQPKPKPVKFGDRRIEGLGPLPRDYLPEERDG